MTCRMDHIVLNVQDEEKMVAFYTEVLPFAPERLEQYRSGKVPFPSVRINSNTIIDLFPKKMWAAGSALAQGPARLNHFCIALAKDGWESLIQRLKANNIEIEEGPVRRWGAHGTGTSVYFRDPEGNRIEARFYEGHDRTEKCLLGS